MLRRLPFFIFGCFGHVQSAAFLFVLAIPAMFRQLDFYYIWPFWLCSDDCIFIISGRFGDIQVAAFVLFSAVLAMFRRPHFFIFGRFGHVQAAALLLFLAVSAMF